MFGDQGRDVPNKKQKELPQNAEINIHPRTGNLLVAPVPLTDVDDVNMDCNSAGKESVEGYKLLDKGIFGDLVS